ncbi:TIGR00730 family Rossman fold protein [Ensifer aridi]|uniref:LOG family protein n=1 Tax=Ensifer aridi TaxID=1708715 RepID=UPI00097C6510|nr:TIGR00730 family Rossman fold protein [Ensifer aridi]
MRYCVCSGSNPGRQPFYVNAANRLGEALAVSGIGLVHGGASVSLMGTIADAVLSNGAELSGALLSSKRLLIPVSLRTSMHERKALMAALPEGFSPMTGGLGTLGELLEVWTWAQFGYHKTPSGLLDIAGFYRRLASFLDHVVHEAFLTHNDRDILLAEEDLEALLPGMTGGRTVQKTSYRADDSPGGFHHSASTELH